GPGSRPSGWRWRSGCWRARRPPAAGFSGLRSRSCGLLGHAALSGDRVQLRQRPLEIELLDGLAESLETGPGDRARERGGHLVENVGGAPVARREQLPEPADRRAARRRVVGFRRDRVRDSARTARTE